MTSPLPPDTLNDIGVLKRREIEARILAPLIDAFAAEFGREQVLETVRRVITRIARDQGKALAGHMGGNTLAHLVKSQANWLKGDSLTIEVRHIDDTAYDYDVTRCRYAEMYQALGIPELGAILSCGRDFALGEGFNPDLKLTRTQTIMEGAPRCDFRYRLEASASSPPMCGEPRRDSGPAA
jgi:hypothetical protein